MKRSLSAIAALLCLSAATWHGNAAAQSGDAWQFTGALYLYVPTIAGKSTFPESGASVESRDLLDLKATFMGLLEAHKGRWGAFTDVMYVDVGNSKSATRDFALGGAALPVGATAGLNFDIKGTAWTLAGTYRAITDPSSPMDVFAGARLLDVQQDLSWQLAGNVGAIPAPGRAGNQSASLTNWDAIVGVKGRLGLGGGSKWFAPYYLDLGTGESERTWQAFAGVGYAFNWGEIVGVWRHLDYKMKSAKAFETLTMDGPAVGAVWHW